jgi:protoporphyrinogen oxidase
MQATQQVDVLVAGGGISGCAAARELARQGVDYRVIEKNAVAGGLTRSVDIGDAHFDYTGHFLHLSACSSPAALPYAGQDNRHWQRVRRTSAVFVDGRAVPAPFQYNLHALPEPVRRECMETFRSRPPLQPGGSFKDYLLSGFGQGMCEHFLFPYNRKMLAIDLDELSMNALSRFFPGPDPQTIEAGFNGPPSAAGGYNDWFWYPRYAGIGLLSRGLSDGLGELQTACPLLEVDLASKTARTALGPVRYTTLLSSIPLKDFCRLTGNAELRRLAAQLSHTRVLCLNLLYAQEFSQKFSGCHWVYVPDEKIPFYRVGIYSNIPETCFPSGCSALYVETAFSDHAELPGIDGPVESALDWLDRLGWVRRETCRIIGANWIDCAYVRFDHAWQQTRSAILEILREREVYPIGRYGRWEYVGMEESILSGIKEAARMGAGSERSLSEKRD